MVEALTLAIIFVDFLRENVGCCMDIVTLPPKKNVTTQNGLLIFLWKETHSETKAWKKSRLLRVNPKIFICLSFFEHFSQFFRFFIPFDFFILLFFHFSIFFHYFIFSFFQFLKFSVMFFLFLFLFLFFFFSFSFPFCWVLKICFFLGLNFVTDHFLKKKQFFGPSREVPL